MIHHVNEQIRIATRFALLATSVLALASCGSPASPASGETSANSSTAAGTGTEVPGTSLAVVGDTVALVKQLASEARDLPIDTLEVNDPFTLEPSTCVLWSAWPINLIDYGAIPMVMLNDGPANDVVVVDSSDEHLGAVAQRCFIDQGLVPTADVGVRLVMSLSRSLPPRTLPYGGPRNQPIGTSQIAWEAPAVTATDDGFVVTFLATEIMGIDHDYRVTATIAPTSDGTARVIVDSEDL